MHEEWFGLSRLRRCVGSRENHESDRHHSVSTERPRAVARALRVRWDVSDHAGNMLCAIGQHHVKQGALNMRDASLHKEPLVELMAARPKQCPAIRDRRCVVAGRVRLDHVVGEEGFPWPFRDGRSSYPRSKVAPAANQQHSGLPGFANDRVATWQAHQNTQKRRVSER